MLGVKDDMWETQNKKRTAFISFSLFFRNYCKADDEKRGKSVSRSRLMTLTPKIKTKSVKDGFQIVKSC